MRKLFRMAIPIGALGLVFIIVALLSSSSAAQQLEPTPVPNPPYVELVNNEEGLFMASIETIEVGGGADLAVLRVTATPSPTLRSESIHVEVWFTNLGDKQASNIDGALLVDAGSAWRWQCSGCWWNLNNPPSTTYAFFQSTGLHPGEMFSITVDIYPTSLFPVKVVAGAFSPNDVNPDNNSQTIIVPVYSSADPDIQVFPTLFRFDLTSGETVITSFTVTNTGAADLFYRAEPTELWLATDVVTGTLESGQSQIVTMTVNTAGLPGGDHTGAVMVYSNDPDRSSEGVVVHLRVRAPNITVEPRQFRVNLQAGETLTQMMRIGNQGNVSGSWRLEIPDTATWLTGEPLSGTIEAGGFVDVGLRFNATGLAEGTYSEVLHVLSNDRQHPDQTVLVIMVVGSADIEVLVSREPASVEAGQQISMLFATRNNSSLHVYDTVVTFRLEEPVLETVGTEFSVRLRDLEPGQTLWWRLYAWVRPGTPGGVYRAEVELASGITDPKPENNLRPWRITVKPLLTYLALIVSGYPKASGTPTPAPPPTVTPTPTLIPLPTQTPGPTPTRIPPLTEWP